MDGFNADKLVRHTHIHTQHLNVNIKKNLERTNDPGTTTTTMDE